MMRIPRTFSCVLLYLATVAPLLSAQVPNILLPIDTIELRMTYGPLDVLQSQGSRFEDDRTQRVTLQYPDESVMLVKWAKAARGGSAFNNEPRYELAAYELQKLFLEQDEYVVPPTVARAVPLGWYRETLNRDAMPTFDEVPAVVVLLQYWMYQVTPDDFWSEDRFERNPLYRHHFANFNILTYLIDHKDANEGNYLISVDSMNPRVYSVDNGLAFRSRTSDRGTHWRRLRVDRLPRSTIERLRTITPAQLRDRLGVLVQFAAMGGNLVLTPQKTQNLDPGDGIRVQSGIVQFGLTEREIQDVWDRLQQLLQDVDDGEITLFED